MAMDLPWRGVEPLTEPNGDVRELLDATDSLRRVWDENLAIAAPEEIEEARKRSLRRHAIETGVIERLYDLDWGVTEALVAEGLTLDAVAGEGGITEDTLTIIRDQYSALDYLADVTRDGLELSLHFIHELHQLITRHQSTHEARDTLGRLVHVPLRQGEWKTRENHAVRDDGSRVMFAPPEQVQPAMERLLELYRQAESAHPIVRAAWLHHRFILIHPFADGNGRVARALTLLVLLQAHYAPLVVDRRQRSDYITALNQANSGDLRPLIRFLARLERIALTSALTRPAEHIAAGAGAVATAFAYADRLRIIGQRENDAHTGQAHKLAADLHDRLQDYLLGVREKFREAFRSADPNAEVNVYRAAPGEERASWWRAQLVRTAKVVDFYSNLRDGSWWTQLRLTVFGQTLRYVVAVQKVGRGNTGVLAVTVFAESVESHTERTGDARLGRETAHPLPLLNLTPDDSVTLIYTDSADARWLEVCDLVDRTLAAATASFSSGLG